MEFSRKARLSKLAALSRLVASGWIRLDQEARLLELARNALGLFKSLLGNRLVIVAPADTALKLDIKAGFDLAGALKGGHPAMADPDRCRRENTGRLRSRWCRRAHGLLTSELGSVPGGFG